MKSKLRRINNWEALAAQCEYSTAAMVRACGVSERQLERFFLQTRGMSPHRWLDQLRMRRALEVLRECGAVKEASQIMGFRQTSHFSRVFKKHHGMTPEQWQLPVATSLRFKAQPRVQ